MMREYTMMRVRILLLLLLLGISVHSVAQSLVVTQAFQEVPNTTVLSAYGDKFAKWQKPALDDTFPFVLIRVGLDGSTEEIAQAKQMLGLNMGTQTAVEAIDRSTNDELLFLIPKRARRIEIQCGDGCASQILFDNATLTSNKVYYGRVHYVPMADIPGQIMQTRQKFQLSVSPSNAIVEVFVDGKREFWPVHQGVATKMINCGNYRYRITAKNYYPEESSMIVMPHSTELQVSLRPKFGWLSVDGDTQIYGAHVYAINIETEEISLLGNIPLQRVELNPGRYALVILQEKYKEYNATVTIREAENTAIRPVLASNYSSVTLSTTPMAEIYIDGNKVGKGEWHGTLEYGTYRVETRQQSHHSAFTDITISAGDANVAYTLNNPTPLYGTLIVDGNPADAMIWIDNEQKGITPMVFNRILVGEHKVRIAKDGFTFSEQLVAIEDGQDKYLSYTLNQADGVVHTNMPTLSLSNSETHSFHVKDITFTMVKVKAGTFIMGATEEQREDMNDNEIPIHQVSVSDFYMGQTEVTQALWQAVMGDNPSAFPSNPSNPVENISWEDCQTFVRKLNQLTGQSFRLPTEAEWEFAARGGADTIDYVYAGDNIPNNVAWHVDNSMATTHIVATKSPNQLGLYDMSGNVCEWCQDWYGTYEMSNQKDPQGPANGSYKVYRGGSWYFDARYARVSQRNYHTPTFSNYNIGLRLALTTISTEQVSMAQGERKEPVAPAMTDSANIVEVAGVSFSMIPVEGGTFMMGATPEQGADALGGERPTRKITLSNYSISQTEVTQALWQAVMGTNPSADTTYSINPVTNVSWEDCQRFITKLNELTQQHFRLPTEAEWEYAARGGQLTTKTKFAGSNDVHEVAWNAENSERQVQPIGQKQPNQLGIYDMSGNVREWCQDWFGAYEGDALNNPKGPQVGVYRVTRGGSAMLPSRMNRVSSRDGYAVADAFADLGFRLVRSENEYEHIPVKKVEVNRKEPTLRFEIRNVSFTMVKVPSGSFVMGATEEQGTEVYDWEKPKHYVTLGDYYIGQTEVTQDLWKAVMGVDTVPCAFQNAPTNPMENISWEDCQIFIQRLNKLTGVTFRLPTEAEWEFAARGGTNTKGTKCAGADKPDDVAWFRDNSLLTTHPVGLKLPNELGLYDMNGNVWEWCQDWYADYDATSQINPTGPAESETHLRVIRGGSWAFNANNCRVSVRHGQVDTERKIDIGFRLAL